MVSDNIKRIIIKKLYNDLKGVEIIPYNDSIFFIDRKNKYWYFEYDNSGNLWWRYDFFKSFFSLFSLESKEYEKILAKWVEDILNCKVVTPNRLNRYTPELVEDILNCKVVTPPLRLNNLSIEVEDVLNCKVVTTIPTMIKVEDILNCKVNTTIPHGGGGPGMVEDILNCNILTTKSLIFDRDDIVGEVLNEEN